MTAGAWDSLAALGRWFGALELLSFAVFALLMRAMSRARDRGVAVAKLLAWLTPGSLVWFAASTGLAPNTAGTARTAAALVLAAGAVEAWRSRRVLHEVLTTHARSLLALEGLYCAVFGLFALARAFKPAIIGSEKPMDFAILNACLRATSFPPVDPWFSGGALNYYYFGHALTAVFTHLTGVGAATAFNLALPALAAMLAVLVCAAVFQVTGRVAAGVFAVVLVVFMGNLDGLRLFAGQHVPRVDADYFWQTSRVIAGTINEYPFWSLLFGDLHAHVFVMPLSAGLLYLGCVWQVPVRRNDGGACVLYGALAAWLLGAVSATSAWSLPSMAGLALGFLLVSSSPGRGRGRLRLAAVGSLALAAILGAAFMLFHPFWSRYLPSGASVGLGPRHGAKALDAFTVFGVFLALVLLPLLAGALRGLERRVSRAALLAGAVGTLVLGDVWSGGSAVYAAWLLLALPVWLSATHASVRVGAMLCAAACGLGLLTELVTVSDRMNTVFKYYLDMWVMFGPAAAILLSAAWDGASRNWRRAYLSTAAAVALAGLFTTLTGVYGFYRVPRRVGDPLTLDGQAFLVTEAPAEREAYDWLNREVAGAPVVLEAHGDAYRDFARVSMNTGLPTILGWANHLVQQGRALAEVQRRAGDIRRMYESASTEQAADLLRRYRVDLIVIGPVERAVYSAGGLATLASVPGFEPVFRNDGVTIYASAAQAGRVAARMGRGGPARSAPQLDVSLDHPHGLALASDGTLAVTDVGHHRVVGLGSAAGAQLVFGGEGSGPREFRKPRGIAFDARGNLWVADTGNHRVLQFSRDGEPLDVPRSDLNEPHGIAVAPNGDIFVADSANHRVMRFSASREQFAIGSAASLDYPVGVSLTPQGDVAIADAGTGRVAVFTDDGALLRSWPTAVSGSEDAEPALAVDGTGVVWVTDPAGHRVLLFAADGRPLGEARPDLHLVSPAGIVVVDSASGYVADAGAGRVVRISRQR